MGDPARRVRTGRSNPQKEADLIGYIAEVYEHGDLMAKYFTLRDESCNDKKRGEWLQTSTK